MENWERKFFFCRRASNTQRKGIRKMTLRTVNRMNTGKKVFKWKALKMRKDRKTATKAKNKKNEILCVTVEMLRKRIILIGSMVINVNVSTDAATQRCDFTAITKDKHRTLTNFSFCCFSVESKRPFNNFLDELRRLPLSRCRRR